MHLLPVFFQFFVDSQILVWATKGLLTTQHHLGVSAKFGGNCLSYTMLYPILQGFPLAFSDAGWWYTYPSEKSWSPSVGIF